jgi:hypothetical protein
MRAIALNPTEAVPGAKLTLIGESAYRSYDVLGGGGVITGGTFSRAQTLLNDVWRERELNRHVREGGRGRACAPFAVRSY